jgi:predicted O-methyltransferase YrrM
VLRQIFVAGQRAGVDILPRHFYSSIPDVRALRTSRGWRQPYSLVGLSGFDPGQQIATLDRWFAPDVRRRIGERDLRAEASQENGAVGYGPSESTVLHAFVATERPRRVVQIGAGVSTSVILTAAREAGHEIEVTCVDPYPTDYLVRLASQGQIVLDRRPAQEVPVDELAALESGDLLFVDSTHTVKPGSEVNRIILELLPRLRPGVWVHFHDIWLPYDYPRDMLTDSIFFWNESPMLHAYLADNARMTTRVCCSWLHYEARDELTRVVPGYRAQRGEDGLADQQDPAGHFPSSIYLQVQQ